MPGSIKEIQTFGETGAERKASKTILYSSAIDSAVHILQT